MKPTHADLSATVKLLRPVFRLFAAAMAATVLGLAMIAQGIWDTVNRKR